MLGSIWLLVSVALRDRTHFSRSAVGSPVAGLIRDGSWVYSRSCTSAAPHRRNRPRWWWPGRRSGSRRSPVPNGRRCRPHPGPGSGRWRPR
ncbi:hypothetical protein VlrB [Dichelobacter nodosus VCS1703A]|uniref:Uncharacterized protein n=1 Tax=Dichelobacter nodosus (strain VCS1703A) TaxID=246195 RepID=A5EWI6_DICNV|nr:hypothetical protein VlrB [Dichelobacter nodosus VCS1703A]